MVGPLDGRWVLKSWLANKYDTTPCLGLCQAWLSGGQGGSPKLAKSLGHGGRMGPGRHGTASGAFSLGVGPVLPPVQQPVAGYHWALPPRLVAAGGGMQMLELQVVLGWRRSQATGPVLVVVLPRWAALLWG